MSEVGVAVLVLVTRARSPLRKPSASSVLCDVIGVVAEFMVSLARRPLRKPSAPSVLGLGLGLGV
jgi:hypothetical protein